QLSNSLYDAALQSGCDIVERHRHSRRVAGSAAAHGRDATVAWNYVDFRFRATRALRVCVAVEDDMLKVVFAGLTVEGPARAIDARHISPEDQLLPARSCATCDETPCFRHEDR